jgi:hypothetical protein
MCHRIPECVLSLVIHSAAELRPQAQGVRTIIERYGLAISVVGWRSMTERLRQSTVDVRFERHYLRKAVTLLNL